MFVSKRFATPLQQYLQTHLEIGPQELQSVVVVMTTSVTLTSRKYQQQQPAQQRPQQQQQHLQQLIIVRFHYQSCKCKIIPGQTLSLDSHVYLKLSRYNMRTINNEIQYSQHFVKERSKFLFFNISFLGILFHNHRQCYSSSVYS